MCVEENAAAGGAGSAVLEALAQAGVVKPVLLLGIPDIVTEHGDADKLLADMDLCATGLQTRVNAWLGAHSANLPDDILP